MKNTFLLFVLLFYCISTTTFAQNSTITDVQKQLEIAKQEKDNEEIFHQYTLMAAQSDLGEPLNAYLDSASSYLSKVKNAAYIAGFYTIKGFQSLNTYNGEKKAYEYYYKAIDYDNQSGEDREEHICQILQNLYALAHNTMDSLSIQRVMRDIYKMQGKVNKPESKFIINHILSSASFNDYEALRQESKLDSAAFYFNIGLNIYHQKSESIHPISALNMFKNGIQIAIAQHRYEAADSLCSEAQKRLSQNPRTQITLLYFKSIILENQKRYAEAEREALKVEALLEESQPAYQSIDRMNICNLLTNIYQALGKYPKALDYALKAKDIALDIENRNSKGLIAQLEAENTEIENTRLKSDLLFQSKAKRLYATILVLSIVIILVLIIVFYAFRKKMQQKTMLQLQLKDEQAANAELEKYEILSDYHLKELEIEGKNNELNELRKSKELLDQKIYDYKKQISQYETAEEKKMLVSDNFCDLLKADIEKLINNRLTIPNNKKVLMIDNLKIIDKHFIDFIRSHYNGTLSTQYIKYCVGFAIGLKGKDIAQCFSVELPSVHMIRYRMKKKFDLPEQEDLEFFLRKGISQKMGEEPIH